MPLINNPISAYKNSRLAFKLWRAHRNSKKAQVTSELIEEEPEMKKWHQSTTIRGLAAAAVALGLQWVGIENTVAVSDQLVDAILQVVQVIGLVTAAIGRKRASGPLA